MTVEQNHILLERLWLVSHVQQIKQEFVKLASWLAGWLIMKSLKLNFTNFYSFGVESLREYDSTFV